MNGSRTGNRWPRQGCRHSQRQTPRWARRQHRPAGPLPLPGASVSAKDCEPPGSATSPTMTRSVCATDDRQAHLV